jgi:hypothetical protein
LALAAHAPASSTSRSVRRAPVEDDVSRRLEQLGLDVLVDDELAALTMPMSRPARIAW